MPKDKPRVFVDADVLFAGAAAPSHHGASHVVLRMGEITLLECLTSEQVITEVERNLSAKIADKLPEFRLIVGRAVRVVPDPELEELAQYEAQADPKDLPILVAALQNDCPHLLTFDVRHFTPHSAQIAIQRPGEFLLAVRDLLSGLTGGQVSWQTHNPA